MAAYFFDTSGLVKGYVQERGASRVARITSPSAGHDLYVARIVGPELIATLTRLRRSGEVTAEDSSRRYSVVEITENLVAEAMDLVARHTLRGADAIHLAAALEAQRERHASGASSLTFVSADERQLAAARRRAARQEPRAASRSVSTTQHLQRDAASAPDSRGSARSG